MFVNFDNNGRISMITYESKYANEGYIELELPEEVVQNYPFNYLYLDGEFVYDPLPEPDPPISIEEVKAKADEASESAKQANETATGAKTTADTVQEQMDALTSAFATKDGANA